MPSTLFLNRMSNSLLILLFAGISVITEHHIYHSCIIIASCINFPPMSLFVKHILFTFDDFSVHVVLWARTHPELFFTISGANIRTIHAHALWNQGSHRAPNRVLQLMLSLKDMSEPLYLFLLYPPTQTTCVHECTHAHLRPRGCNQGNVLANLLCNSNPKGGWVMMHYNNYTPTEHTMSTLLCCCSQMIHRLCRETELCPSSIYSIYQVEDNVHFSLH